jgi:hypothetical protein
MQSRDLVKPITVMLTCTCIFNWDMQSNSCFQVHLSRSVKWLAFLFTITSRASLGPVLLAGGQSWFFFAGAKDKNTRGFTLFPFLVYIPFLMGKKDVPAMSVLSMCLFFAPFQSTKKCDQFSRKLVWTLCCALHIQGWYIHLSDESNKNLHLRFHSCGVTLHRWVILKFQVV